MKEFDHEPTMEELINLLTIDPDLPDLAPEIKQAMAEATASRLYS